MYNKVTFTTENGNSISHILNEKSTNLVKKSQIWACKNKYKYIRLVWTVPESGWWLVARLLTRDGTRWMLCGLSCCSRCRTQVDEDQLRILINFDILFWSSWKFIIHIKTIISLWSCQAQHVLYLTTRSRNIGSHFYFEFSCKQQTIRFSSTLWLWLLITSLTRKLCLNAEVSRDERSSGQWNHSIVCN